MGSSAGGEEGDPGVKKDGRDVGTWEAVVVAAACSVGGADERRWWVPTAKCQLPSSPPSIVNAAQ